MSVGQIFKTAVSFQNKMSFPNTTENMEQHSKKDSKICVRGFHIFTSKDAPLSLQEQLLPIITGLNNAPVLCENTADHLERQQK